MLSGMFSLILLFRPVRDGTIIAKYNVLNYALKEHPSGCTFSEGESLPPVAPGVIDIQSLVRLFC
jgi:hypothetical protein